MLSDPINPWPKGQVFSAWPFGHGLNEVSLLVNPFLPLALAPRVLPVAVLYFKLQQTIHQCSERSNFVSAARLTT